MANPLQPHLARQFGHLDNDLLASTHLLRTGVGRDVGQLEQLASVGIKRYTLIDPGTVEPENVCQSGFTLADLGKLKVEAAAEHIRAFQPDAVIETIPLRHSEVKDLRQRMGSGSLVCDGVDDLSVAADIAQQACATGADVLHIRTSGDSRQFIIAGTMRKSQVPGCIRCRLKGAFDAIESGFQSPEFFTSFRLVPERLNNLAAWVTLGLLHHNAGSALPIAEVGKHFLQHPAWVGLNGIDPASGEIFPVKEYREQLPPKWACPVCGNEG